MLFTVCCAQNEQVGVKQAFHSTSINVDGVRHRHREELKFRAAYTFTMVVPRREVVQYLLHQRCVLAT